MKIAPQESKTFRKSMKRFAYFLVCAFVLCLPESYLLVLAKVSPVVNGIIVILTACVLYLIFLLICAKIDKKRAKQQAENSAKDPFSH